VGALVGHKSAKVVVDDLDVVPIRIEHKRAVVARVVHHPLPRSAVVGVAPASAVAWNARTVASSDAGNATWRCSVSGRSSRTSEKL
jgi:hypothetical protein